MEPRRYWHRHWTFNPITEVRVVRTVDGVKRRGTQWFAFGKFKLWTRWDA